MLAVCNDPDPTLQALLCPLMLLDSQPQHALDLGNSLRELADEIDDAPVPRCLPMIRFCIQTIERMVTEMLIYRLLLLHRLQRTLTTFFRRFGRAPLIDLELQ